MIPLLLMLAAADAPAKTPVDAERAFAADAKTIGQWTAFRKWSTDDAVMFVPQPTNVHEFLKERKDPPQAIDWWPTASYISCDGKEAVNTGGWRRPDGSVGYFTTVWQQQADGSWKWAVDGGDSLRVARGRPASPKIVRASCRDMRPKTRDVLTITGTPDPASDAKTAVGGSKDNSLTWLWIVKADGNRRFMVSYWNGRTFVDALDDKIPAPPK
jgi:hypothetical protein